MQEEAERAGAMHITERWLGGLMTNFQTVKKQLRRLKELEAGSEEGGDFDNYTKKERLMLTRQRDKLSKNLSGIKNLSRLRAQPADDLAQLRAPRQQLRRGRRHLLARRALLLGGGAHLFGGGRMPDEAEHHLLGATPAGPPAAQPGLVLGPLDASLAPGRRHRCAFAPRSSSACAITRPRPS